MMRAEQSDQLAEPIKKPGLRLVHLVLAALVLLSVALVWWFSKPQEAEMPVAVESVDAPFEVAQVPLAPAPDIPRPATPISGPAEDAETDVAVVAEPPRQPTLPAQDKADQWLVQQLTDLGVHQTLLNFLDVENPLTVSAALLDSTSHGNLLRKMIPGWQPAGAFPAEKMGDNFYLDPAGYARFDTLVSTVVELDPATIEAGFILLRPLYERTFGDLGLDPEDVDNALMRILNQVTAAVEVHEPPQLRQDSVMYTYADPSLEALSTLEKQLLRMGPENVRRLKMHAKIVRAELLSAD